MAIEEATWMGTLPETWNTCPLKYVFSIEKRIAGKEGYTVLSITQSGIKPKNMSAQGQFAQDYSKYQLVYPGDFAMNHMDLLTGWIDISKYEGVTSPDYRVFTNKNPEKFLSEYYKYIFQFCYSGKVFYGMGQGVSGLGRWRLPAEMFLNFRLPVPSIEEQKTIVAYLDQHISKIDSVIAEAKASIEEYKAWKASIIYEAVTKGLDPDVEMKDSGIEWIGTIPEHWKLEKLKRHTSMLTPMRDKPEHLDGEIPWVRIEDYCGKYIDASKEGLGVSSETVTKMNLKVYPVGTVLCTSSCDLGKCAIVSRPLVSNQRFIGIIPNANTCTDYLYYLMLSNAERLNYLSTGTIQANLSRVAFEQLIVQIPPYNEQEEIASYLDKKMMQVDTLIFEKQALIKDLESYKKSLIFEVVTGKRRVC